MGEPAVFFDGSPEIVLDRFQKLTVNSQRRQRSAERNVEKNCGERKKPAGMAFVGGFGRGRPGRVAQSSGRP